MDAVPEGSMADCTRAALSDFAYLNAEIEFEAGSAVELTSVEVKVIVSNALLQLHGEVGRSITVDVLRWEAESSRAILRTPHRSMVKVWSALTLYGSDNGRTLAFRVNSVSNHLMALAQHVQPHTKQPQGSVRHGRKRKATEEVAL